MSSISFLDTNQSPLSLSEMNDEKFIIGITSSYLIVNLGIHMLFYFNIIFNHPWRIRNRIRDLFRRYFQQIYPNKMHSVSTSSLDTEQSSSNETLKPFYADEIASISSSLSSDISGESETILIRSIRSIGFFLCTFLLITNWFRMSIYLFARFYPNFISTTSNFCRIQSFFLHVLTLFHLNLTITIRLFWHYCFIFNRYWQTITYHRLSIYFLCLFSCLCLFTWPSLSHDWGSIEYDGILNLCFVNYTSHFSYTFFILSLTCFFPYLLQMISHYEQMKSIQRRMRKYVSSNMPSSQEKSNIIDQKNQFQCASYVVLIWSLINIILLICIHIPFENQRTNLYYAQMFALILDPILYIFVFRSLSIVTLLRPTHEFYF